MFISFHLIRTGRSLPWGRRRSAASRRGGPRAYGAGYMNPLQASTASSPGAERYAGGPMRCTRAGWARGSPRRLPVSGRAARSGGLITAGWRLCDSYLRVRLRDCKWRRSRLAEPVSPVWPHWVSVVVIRRPGLVMIAGITVGWRVCSSRINLMGSSLTVRMAHASSAGLRLRWSESSMRHAASDPARCLGWPGR